jgi:hypothetical protein
MQCMSGHRPLYRVFQGSMGCQPGIANGCGVTPIQKIQEG